MGEYTDDPDAAARVRAKLAVIEERFADAGLPTCRLCGQRALRLDQWGLCSKTSDAHKAERVTRW